MSARSTKPHEVVERALELSRADGCVVIADEQSTANLRWAGNALTTNGVTRGRTLTVIATVDGKEGTASGVVSRSAVTADELEPLVRAAEAAARGAGPAEDAQPLIADVPASPGFADAPAETSSAVFDDFAPALGEAFARARAGGRELYGFANHELVSSYLGTSTGLRLRHDQPNGIRWLPVRGVADDRKRHANDDRQQAKQEFDAHFSPPRSPEPRADDTRSHAARALIHQHIVCTLTKQDVTRVAECQTVLGSFADAAGTA